MKQAGSKNNIVKVPGFASVILLATLYPTTLLCRLAQAQSGGPYVLEWSTIDGGGGISSGGRYIVTGTIGQPDAAYSESEQYELLGGFWPGEPLCMVDFYYFARFAEQWLNTESGLAGDLDGDNDADLADLKLLADEWLNCCPVHWSLR